MSANSSSSFPSSNSSSISLYHFLQKCYSGPAGTTNTIAITVCSLLLVLPLCVYVVYLGLKQRHQRRSGTAASHSDVFTYNMVAVELMNIAGYLLCCGGVLTGVPVMVPMGICLLSVYYFGQQLFHTLTCVERYVAVVHPVAYLRLRSQKGATARDVSIGCVWLLCFANISCLYVAENGTILSYSVWALVFLFIIISFCSPSVLCVLIGPGPGAGGGGRQRVDRSKMRSFYTIAVIMAVLLVRVGAAAAISATYYQVRLRSSRCTLWLFTSWSSLPCSLVLPLLFLHRAGKLLLWNNSQRSH
ncbi:uncharacterized protein AB9W97_010092 isoform 3-T3 [Spinachia spinachia]